MVSLKFEKQKILPSPLHPLTLTLDPYPWPMTLDPYPWALPLTHDPRFSNAIRYDLRSLKQHQQSSYIKHLVYPPQLLCDHNTTYSFGKTTYTKKQLQSVTKGKSTSFKLRAAELKFRIIATVQPCRGRQKTLKDDVPDGKESNSYLEKAKHAAKYVILSPTLVFLYDSYPKYICSLLCIISLNMNFTSEACMNSLQG